MLRHAGQMRNLKLRAKDGDIGKVDDCYFDDVHWGVRYIVVDTGGWLPGRRVLIAPGAIREADWEAGLLECELTREQVESSPDVSTDKPVSVQLQERLHKHYGWPVYWAPTAGVIDIAPPGQPPPKLREKAEGAREATDAKPSGDPHLRSMREVTGYHIQATDGEIGHVEDFVVDRQRWVIRFIIVDTRNWLPGRKVLVAPDWVSSVDWGERKAHVELTREAVENSPRYAPSEPIDERYAGELHDHYGRPNRWSSAAAAPVHW